MTKPLKKYMKMIFITLKSWVRERFKFTLLFFDEQFEIFAELARRSSMKCSKTTSSLRYENPICWSADMNKVLKKFRCYKGNQFLDRSINLLLHMQNCSENTKHKYPTGAYQLSETIFERSHLETQI